MPVKKLGKDGAGSVNTKLFARPQPRDFVGDTLLGQPMDEFLFLSRREGVQPAGNAALVTAAQFQCSWII
jgi:hypothetical protein